MAGAQSLFTSIFGSPIPGPVRGRTGGTAAGRATASAVGTTTRAVGKVVTDPRFQAAVKTASAATQIGANIKALTTKPPKPPRPDDKKVQDARRRRLLAARGRRDQTVLSGSGTVGQVSRPGSTARPTLLGG
jgi:hypothetical protein